jgi:hypothetical protein
VEVDIEYKHDENDDHHHQLIIKFINSWAAHLHQTPLLGEMPPPGPGMGQRAGTGR